VTLARGGVVWRDSFYSLQELKQFEKQSPRWTWI